MVGLMSVWKLIFLILWSIGFLIFTSCVKAPTYEFDLQLYQVDETLLECPTGWLKFRNQCYYIVQEEATFQQADILCKRYGGHLVKTNGYNSNQGIGKLISNHNISNVWIGLQRKKSGKFWWSDGQQAEAADGFWTTQLPIKSTEYDLCTVMTTTLSDNGEYRWTLSNCDIGYSSVCQTSACVAGQFRCSDGSGCISRSWICDGIHQCSDRSDELMCPGSCGGHLQGILQTFHSPHYPQTYPKYSSCIWRLETPVGTRVHLKFESFAVETLYDKVIIHDGSSEKDPLVGTYSGTDKPSVPYSSSNFYLVIFQSDQDNQMSGFNASFSAVPMDKCGSEMIASSISQWFGSPNFPNSYPNNILCEWIIKTDNSVDLISLQFHSFSLDTSDFIEIRQGESIDSPLYGRFTGDDIPPVFISTSHSFFIRLYTDFTHTGTGFNATFKTGCNNTILQGYARIMSPGYGITKYPNSINCDWTISDPLQRNLSLVFNNDFDTEKGFDNVTVYTNNHTSYTHAGQGAPPAITTQSEHFHVNFSSDSQVNRNGWAITVSFDCPTLNLSDHLQTNSSITTFGTYVLFYCDNGYQLAGTSVLICDIGGRWSTSPPTCNVINCGSPSIPVNTKLVSVSSTSYLGTAVYKCNSGYKMSTNDTSICQSNRQWTALYCTEISCPKLDMTEKLMLKFTTSESHYVYGDIVIYDCDSNYRLIGASMVYCTENGTWSKPTPSCKPPVCPPVYIRNGYTNATNIVVGGDFLQVDCNNGYSLTGNPMVFCDFNGVYTALPYCSDINECETGNVCGGHTCQNTPGSYRCVCNRGYQNPPNSYTVCKDTDECSSFPCTGICENLNGKYRCNCNPPQELYTENIIRIVKRKVLRPNSTCIAVCPSFNVSNGGVIVADTVPLSSGNYIAPTTVKIHCPRGTVPDGSVVVECQLDGTWNNTVTKCINHECEPLAPDNGGILYLNRTRGYNSVVQYSCKEGYELSGVQYRFCQPVNDTKQFEWTGIEPVCKELKCPALPDPANGQAMYGSTTVGSILQYSCNCGYHLIGSKVRKCQPGGLWDGRNAICAPSTVCQSPVSSGSVVMSNVSPFYTVGTEVSFQCKKPGYEIADTTPIKCVLERPTENKRPQYNLMFEMKFLTPGNFNKSCDSHYVNETVEMFKDLVEQTCKDPYRPLTTIKTLVTSGDILQIDLIIQLSEPREGSFDLVCNCSTALTEIVSSGLIQNNINNVTFNGSEDTTCPTVRLRAADRDNITSTSNWSCDEGYDLVHHSEICVKDPEPTCVKSTATAPKYVIEMTAVLIPANLSQPCKENINTAISDILSSTAGVSNSLQNTKTCSKYNIKVFIETAINMTISTVKVTKKYSLVGQTQAILTPCGQNIDDKLLLELRESLSNLPSQTICLQSLQETSITASLWKCSDGYVMDSSGELCHIVTLTTDSVTIETTTAVVSATTVPTKEVTPEVTTAVITVPSTTISSTTTTPTTTTTMKPTTQGTTLPPTSAAFYLIQVEAVFTGTNLTWDGCITATRAQIEEKVESISTSIIKGLTKDWKQCTKQSDIVLLSQTGKIAVTPDRLELTAPFAIQSPSVATNIVTDCANNGVQGHIEAKFRGLLQEINPGVCYVTLQTFVISLSEWSCIDNYEYDPTLEICRLIQTTKSPTTTPSPSNTLMVSDIKYFIPHGVLSLSIQFSHLSIQNEAFCLTEYRNLLVSLMQSQTSLFNNGNMVNAKIYCADIYISLYGTDSMAEDVVLSVSPGMLNGQVAVKLFATSSSFTSNASYNSCIGWIAAKLMNVSSHALIGQSTLQSSNATLCSNVTLNNISITNVAFDCTTGYQKALYNSYFLCLRDDPIKYIAPLLLSYQWHQLSSKPCINSLMTRLSAESIPFVQQYAKQPSCPSDIVLQQNGTVTSSFSSNYSHGNITIAYELSSQTENAGSISTFSSCSVTILQEARTYFEQKSAEIFNSEKVMESCGSTQPVVTMPVVSGYYICPSEKTWDQIKNQCINADGRKKRKKRSVLLTGINRAKRSVEGLTGMNRAKRSVEVLTTTTAFWNSSVPNCIDIKAPVFQNCPTKDIIVNKEPWGPVFVNISQPTAVDNSGISPKITVTPEDFRQPYLFRENTTVTFTAEDGSGNSEQCEIYVILIDIHPLTIRCPVDVVYVPYATSSDVVNIKYNSLKDVVASNSATHITYEPQVGTSIKIKEHVEVKATAHDSNGNTVSCNFTFEATRDDQIPLYKITVVYSATNKQDTNPADCPMKYGTELIHKIQNLSVAECNDSFMLMPSFMVHQDKIVVDISVGFMNFKTLNFDSMKHCGNLNAQKMIDAGNLTLAPSGCEQLELIFIEEETTQDYLCESNFTVLNRTSKYCTYCHKGTFSNQTSGQCEVCPVTQDTLPIECMPCSEDSSVCLDLCKPGEYSPTGLQPCTKCSVGTYTDTYNSTICQSCPPGNSTLRTGTNSLHGCIDECPMGRYSHTGLIPCQPCPQMFYTDKTRSQSCTECPPGQVTASTGSATANQCYDPKVCSNDICNNGTCMPMDSGRHFVCNCLPGFIGAVCDVNVQECDSNPCVNGDCVDGYDSYSCTCYPGYTGHNCETSINDCSLNTCSNGTCIDGVNSSSCLCYDGFTGDSSCVEKTECDPNTCEHGGLCIDLIEDFICNCSGTGYIGKNCSMLPEKCYNGSCLNDGVCHPHVSGYSCSCAQGYTGEYCQINIDECQGHYCRNQAVCVDGVNSYTCLCQPSYNGSHCNYNTMCDTSPCVNGASCQTTLTGFMCNCLLGYSGVLCEVNIDECKQNNCNPDTSQCVDQINSYTCICLPGWTGEFCDEPTNECLSSPCAHSSQCFEHENQFSCSCVDGYTGHNCSTQVIECDSHPCYNDGQCLDQVNGYRCTCKGSFTGSQCEKHIDLCVGSPCLHNGTCQELVDTFLCKCEVGWTGSRCESLIDNCVSLPCYNNAVCINGINQYTCVCKPGYTGSNCQLDIDECLTDPCLHEGVCTNLIGGYYCTCPDGYTGTDCADLDIPCPSCQNGAIECFNGECVCLPGFIGPDCGKEVNPDFDLYFHGNSRIDTGVKRIKNRNQFSVCLWYKAFGLMSSMPVLTLVAVNGYREDDVLSIYSDRIHLSYFRQTEFNISVTPRSWNHLCVTWDSHDSGHWSVYINGWIQVEGNEFGNGQELPQRQKLVFGQATEDSNSTFHGMISRVNLYDTVLNESEITKGGKNCSIGMPVGSVFRWQELTSYISTETAGVNVIEPSLCGSDECPLSYEGEWCNTTEDTEAPTVIYCPEYIQIVTANRLNIVNWTEPQFTDNVGIINVVQTHRSGQVFAYGEYDVMYIAYDTENNTAICSFTVYVIPFNCSLPAPPSNVILTCSTWPEGLQCSVKCQDPRIQSFVEEVPSFYKCGREGFWDPPRGREFNFPSCAESSSPDGTIKGELVYLGPPCTLSSKQILNESFVKNMNNWNMEFGLCPAIGCNFSNITILCVSSGKRRRRSTKSTYNVTFDIPVNGSLMSDGVNALPLTQLETMIKNEEFNTDDFSCDAEKLVVKPYIKCQTGQILVDTTCVNCIRGTYYDNTNELCGVCPIGQYTDQERQTTCKSCALGYTTESSGTTSSTLCYKTCNIGNHYDKRLLDCKPCERGYYQDEIGKTTCKSCGNGQTTENTGSTSVTYCQNSCRAGTELSVSGTCELCAQGTYKSDDSQDTCQPCPYGFSTQNKGATSVQQCSVVSCPPDYKYDSATEKCVVCPPGYHQPYQGQSSCIPCIPKLDIGIKKCSTGEIDECAIHQDNCDDNAECTDTKDSFECQCKFGFKGNGTTCIDKCIGACYGYIACIIDNSGEPQCKQDTSDTFPLIAVAGGGASFVLIIILMIVVGVCRRRSNQKKRKETPHNYQHMDRVHRELEVVTYPRGLPRTVQFSRNNPAYSDSDLSDPTAYHRGQASAPIWARPVFPDHEDLSKYSETSLKRPLRLRITEEMKNDQQFEIESNKSWHDSSPGSSLSQYRDDTHHSSPNSSISKYRVDSNPKDSSPSSSISQYKEDSLHKNDSPISNKSDFSDSFF